MDKEQLVKQIIDEVFAEMSEAERIHKKENHWDNGLVDNCQICKIIKRNIAIGKLLSN